MTVPVPAGAGGVDESDRHCKSCGDRRMRHMPNDGSCTWCDCPSFVPEVTRAELEAALAAAEQRADTAAAAIERVRDLHQPVRVGHPPRTACLAYREHGSIGWRDYPCSTAAALSSRPVQPEEPAQCACRGGPHGGYTCPSCSGGPR